MNVSLGRSVSWVHKDIIEKDLKLESKLEVSSLIDPTKLTPNIYTLYSGFSMPKITLFKMLIWGYYNYDKTIRDPKTWDIDCVIVTKGFLGRLVKDSRLRYTLFSNIDFPSELETILKTYQDGVNN